MSNMKYGQEEDLNEIRKGFEMFDVENKGQIDPMELKDTMEEMNLKDKNPFIYGLISTLCLRKDIRTKGGLTAEEFISFLEENLRDSESKQGIKTIFEVFSDSDNKIPIPTFYQTAREVGDEVGGAEIRDLVEKSKTGGKEIDFNEFYDIMKEKSPFKNFSQYYHKRNFSESSNKSKSKGKSGDKRERENEIENIGNKNNPINTNQQKTGSVIVEKIITEQVDDNPVKVSRYHFKFDKDGKLKESEKNKTEIKNTEYIAYTDKKVEENNNNEEKEDASEIKRYHRRYRENKVNTETLPLNNKNVIYSSNLAPNISNTSIVYTKYTKKA